MAGKSRRRGRSAKSGSRRGGAVGGKRGSQSKRPSKASGARKAKSSVARSGGRTGRAAASGSKRAAGRAAAAGRRSTKALPKRGAKSTRKGGARAAGEAASATSPRATRAGRLVGVRTSETLEQRRERALRILRELHRLYPEATCALHHRSALELLIATILSAQSTDETVNRVTPEFFRRFPTAQAIAEADRAELEAILKPTGFFRQKARSVQEACRVLVERYGGQVPDTMEDLTSLPGVARKTANVVLGTWFGKNEGIVVDTHVGRLAHRLGLTWSSKDDKDAGRIEQDLMQIIPREEWTFFGHALIWHGRRVCTARKPACQECTLARDCPSAGMFS